MKGVIRVNRVNRVNRGYAKRVVIDLPPPSISFFSRDEALQNNPNNPNNPPAAFVPLSDTDRWPIPPYGPDEVKLSARPRLTPEQARAVMMAVSPQPVANIEWVGALSQRYAAARRDWTGRLCERAACLDLLRWQANFTHRGVRHMKSLKSCVIPPPPPPRRNLCPSRKKTE